MFEIYTNSDDWLIRRAPYVAPRPYYSRNANDHWSRINNQRAYARMVARRKQQKKSRKINRK